MTDSKYFTTNKKGKCKYQRIVESCVPFCHPVSEWYCVFVFQGKSLNWRLNWTMRRRRRGRRLWRRLLRQWQSEKMWGMKVNSWQICYYALRILYSWVRFLECDLTAWSRRPVCLLFAITSRKKSIHVLAYHVKYKRFFLIMFSEETFKQHGRCRKHFNCINCFSLQFFLSQLNHW